MENYHEVQFIKILTSKYAILEKKKRTLNSKKKNRHKQLNKD